MGGMEGLPKMVVVDAPVPLALRQGRLGLLRLVFWGLALALGALHAYAGAMRQSMNADGIAYLDMGDAYLRGDWSTAINAVWSPLYSWLLGVALYLIEPAPAWEFVLVHVINFLIYIAALFCFDFFLQEIMRYHRQMAQQSSNNIVLSVPEWAWLSIGYSLFIWSSLRLIRIWAVTPDMCVAAFVYITAGILVRMCTGRMSWRLYAAFGIVLGLGYLAKAAMFPLAFVFLTVSLFVTPDLRRTAPLTLIALGMFLLVASPLLTAISLAKGRVTFSETGKLTYAWFVNGVPYPHWQGGTPGSGTPQHPTRQILDSPPVYEFGSPVGGTYPVAYDPSYWYEGARPHFDWSGQLKVLLSNGEYYFDLFFREQGLLTAVVLLLILMSPRTLQVRHRRVASILFLPGIAALAMYALVYTEGRYIGGFVVLLWMGLLSSISLPAAHESGRLMRSASTVILGAILFQITSFNYEGFRALVLNKLLDIPTNRQGAALGSTQDLSHGASWEVAVALKQLGMQPGDKVAFLGYSFDASWARLARVQVVAETFPSGSTEFWAMDDHIQADVIQAFSNTKAKAIVAEYIPSGISTNGWHRVGNTSYHVYFLVK